MNLSTLLAATALVMIPALASMQSVRAEEMKGMNMSAKPAASPADKAFAAWMQTMMKGMKAFPTRISF